MGYVNFGELLILIHSMHILYTGRPSNKINVYHLYMYRLSTCIVLQNNIINCRQIPISFNYASTSAVIVNFTCTNAHQTVTFREGMKFQAPLPSHALDDTLRWLSSDFSFVWLGSDVPIAR